MADTSAATTNSLPTFNTAALQYSFSRRSPKRPRPVYDNDSDLDNGDFLKRGPPAAGIDDLFTPWDYKRDEDDPRTIPPEAPPKPPSQVQDVPRKTRHQIAKKAELSFPVQTRHQIPNDAELSFPVPSGKAASEGYSPIRRAKRARMAFNWDCIKNVERRLKISRWKGKKIALNQGRNHPKKYPKRQDYAQNRPRKNGRFVSANDPEPDSSQSNEASSPALPQ